MNTTTRIFKTVCLCVACLFLQNFNTGKGIEKAQSNATHSVRHACQEPYSWHECNHAMSMATDWQSAKTIDCVVDANGLKTTASLGIFQNTTSYSIKKVVLDAGHGGKDPGCSGKFSKEKDNVLNIALTLGSFINQNYPEVEVIYTRTSDVFIPLHERARIANDNNVDLFISIHCNALPSAKSIAGTETYVLGQHVADDNLAVMLRENASIYLEDNYTQNYEGYDPNSPEAHIMGNMMQNAFLEQSLVFAGFVQKHANEYTGLKNRGVKQAGFLVLRETGMPSVLVETGYLTNASDEQYLLSPEGQQQMALSIFEAFKSYKLTYESKLSEPKSTPIAYKPEPVRRDTAKSTPVLPVKTQRKVMPEAKTEPQKTFVKSAQNNQKTKESPTKNTTSKTETPFTIFLLQSEKQADYKKSNLNLLPGVVEEKENGLFRYFVGNFATHNEAETMLAEVRNLGFPTAQIVFK